MGIYRPPYTTRNKYTNDSFVTDFLTLSEDLVSVYENIIFLGDFNFHSEEDHAFQDFTISLDAMGLHQHVAFSTHEKGNILDLCITEKVGLLSGVDCCPGPFLSDHRIVNIVFTFTKSNLKKTSVEFRNFKLMDTKLFREKIQQLKINATDVNCFVRNMEGSSTSILDECAPLEKKLITNRPRVPWFSEEIAELKRVMRRREIIWRRYREPHQREAFLIARSNYRSALKTEKSNLYLKRSQVLKVTQKSCTVWCLT